MSYCVVENNILGKIKPHTKRQRAIPVVLKTTPNKSGYSNRR